MATMIANVFFNNINKTNSIPFYYCVHRYHLIKNDIDKIFNNDCNF